MFSKMNGVSLYQPLLASLKGVCSSPPLSLLPDVLLLQRQCERVLEGRDIFLNSQKGAEILSSLVFAFCFECDSFSRTARGPSGKVDVFLHHTLNSKFSYFYRSVGSWQLILHPEHCVKFFCAFGEE